MTARSLSFESRPSTSFQRAGDSETQREAVLAAGQATASIGQHSAAFHLFIAFSTIIAAVAAFAVWTPFGFVATVLITAVLAVSLPAVCPP